MKKPDSNHLPLTTISILGQAPRNWKKGKKKQQGLVLLVMVIIIFLAASSYYFSTISITEIKVDNIKRTQIALQQAKQALIAYAINYPEITPTVRGPGYLLCPDTDNNGLAETACNGSATIGRLPWNTLNIGDLRDGANERLWYAVSENFDYTNSPAINKINSETIGNITVRDNNNSIIYNGTGMDGVVAVIIAPGTALTRGDGIVQNRSHANVNIVSHYLDIDNTNSPAEDNADFEQGIFGGANVNGFIQGEVFDGANNVIVNDLIEVITYNDIMSLVHKRVSQEISNLIEDYFTSCNAYPEASAFDPSKAFFNSEASPPPTELRKGHLPFDTALPVDWDTGCAAGIKPKLWLSAEDWGNVTYYAFSFQNAPPANVYACGNGANPACLTVNSIDPVINTSSAQALIMFSARDLTGGNRPSSIISDYFEMENSDLDNVFDADETEDYIRVMNP